VDSIGEIKALSIKDKSLENSAPVFHLKVGVAQKTLERGEDRFAGELVGVTQNPLAFKQDGLAEPQAVRFQGLDRHCKLLGIVRSDNTDDHIGIQ